jgi:hypothetical protein
MADGAVKSHQPMAAPQWLFPWRVAKVPPFPMVLALGLVGTMFAVFITQVRVQVMAPEKASLRKASLIYLGNDAQGRALSLRAREGGPFPSRFELSQWRGLERLENAVLDATRIHAPLYVPALQELPVEIRVKPLALAAKGECFFPKRSPLPVDAPDMIRLQPTPVLSPLAGVSTSALPTELPPFDTVVDGAMSAASWRFLVRLNPTGGVAECVSLEKGGEPGAAELAAWLHRTQFQPEPGKPFRWIAVAIGFTNPAADGTHAR